MTHKNKITYLIGAGASYHALPVVGNMKARLRVFWEFLNDPSFQRKRKILPIYNIIHDQVQIHKSPDTYARILYLQKDQTTLAALKRYLCLYFSFEQLLRDDFEYFDKRGFGDDAMLKGLKNQFDHRYVSFLSTVSDLHLNSEIRLPANLSVVSWNYDAQLEIAFGSISRLSSLKEIRWEMGVLQERDNPQVSPRLIKVNGSADFFNSSNEPRYEYLQRNIKEEIEFGDQLSGMRSEQVNLHFAWEEKNQLVAEAREKAKRFLGEADVIVVIGYSFPDFNRSIDKQFFSTADPAVIYVQDEDPHKIIERLEGVKRGLSKIAVPLKDTSQFHIPFEFWEEKI